MYYISIYEKYNIIFTHVYRKRIIWHSYCKYSTFTIRIVQLELIDLFCVLDPFGRFNLFWFQNFLQFESISSRIVTGMPAISRDSLVLTRMLGHIYLSISWQLIGFPLTPNWSVIRVISSVFSGPQSPSASRVTNHIFPPAEIQYDIMSDELNDRNESKWVREKMVEVIIDADAIILAMYVVIGIRRYPLFSLFLSLSKMHLIGIHNSQNVNIIQKFMASIIYTYNFGQTLKWNY